MRAHISQKRSPLQVRDERFGGTEALRASTPDILLRFAFTSLPFIRPEVRLRRVDEALLAENDLVRSADLGHENITLGRAHAAAELRRKSDLAIAAQGVGR